MLSTIELIQKTADLAADVPPCQSIYNNINNYVYYGFKHSSIYLHTFQNANTFGRHAALELKTAYCKIQKQKKQLKKIKVLRDVQSWSKHNPDHMQEKVTPTKSYPGFHSYLP